MMTYKEMTITPEVASEMLKRNTSNYRKVHKAHVDLYASDMKAGRWQNTGEPICFDEDGNLKDGQHRLMAIVQAGVTLPMLVVEGVARGVDNYDVGKPRTLQDIASSNGLTIKAQDGGVANIMLSKFGTEARKRLSKSAVIDYYADNATNITKARILSTHGNNYRVITKSSCMAALFCAIELGIMSDKDIEAFCVIANSGLPNPDYVSDAPLMLRRMIVSGIRDKAGNLYSQGQGIIQPLFEITWQALTAFKEGRRVQKRFIPNGEGRTIIDQVHEQRNAKAKTA